MPKPKITFESWLNGQYRVHIDGQHVGELKLVGGGGYRGARHLLHWTVEWGSHDKRGTGHRVHIYTGPRSFADAKAWVRANPQLLLDSSYDQTSLPTEPG